MLFTSVDTILVDDEAPVYTQSLLNKIGLPKPLLIKII